MNFSSGDSYVMPDMILHYIFDHGWVPPKRFIDDVMNREVISSDREQMRGSGLAAIGYLRKSFEAGNVPEGFIEKLEVLMVAASQSGDRLQTKSL